MRSEGGKILVYENQQIKEKTGLITLPLSSQEKPLTQGSQYIWEVAISCNPNSSLFDQTFVGEVKVVPPSSYLAYALAMTTENPLDKSKLYAEEGYWYDAIAEAMLVQPQNNSNNIDDQVIELIDDLAQIESSNQAVNLKQIAQILGNKNLD